MSLSRYPDISQLANQLDFIVSYVAAVFKTTAFNETYALL